MRTVSLQGTHLTTSRLGLGTSGLHQILRGRTRQDLLAAAFDVGIRHFDTSPYYGHGIAERELGTFMRTRRREVLIATKFGIKASPLLARLPWLMYAQLIVNAAQRKLTRRNWLTVTPARDYTAREARLSLERSLRALKTDYVDIYFLHDPGKTLLGPNDELLAALEGLIRNGMTRYVGVAGRAQDCIEIAARFPRVAQIMQINAAQGARELDLLSNSGLPCHFSFGHFRDKHASTKSLLNDAVKANAGGVVLYSSRFRTRVAEIAGLLPELERP